MKGALDPATLLYPNGCHNRAVPRGESVESLDQVLARFDHEIEQALGDHRPGEDRLESSTVSRINTIALRREMITCYRWALADARKVIPFDVVPWAVEALVAHISEQPNRQGQTGDRCLRIILAHLASRHWLGAKSAFVALPGVERKAASSKLSDILESLGNQVIGLPASMNDNELDWVRESLPRIATALSPA
jgi:hypothetical protein